MTDILFQATIEDFHLVPFMHLTQKTKWSKDGQRYLKSQADLAMLFKAKYKRREPIDEFCVISMSVHVPHKRHVDVTNLLKAVEDALQYGGILENDYLIAGIDKTRRHQKSKGPARVVVSLKRLDD